VTSASHVVLPGSQRPLLPGSRAIGPAPANEQISITVKLRRKKALPAITNRPKSAMSRADFAAEYGASADDIQKVKTALGLYGLQVQSEDPASRSIDFSGPVSAMEKAFEVKLFNYAHEGGDYRGRSGVLHIPSELKDIVVGVYGLDDRRVIRRRKRRPGATPAAVTHATGTHAGFLPAELAALYDFPPGDGAGQSIGILEFGGGFLPDDLALFCSSAGVAVPTIVPVSIDHTPTNIDNAEAGEVMLDVEVVAGVCPKATIPVYFGKFTERGWIRTIDRAIHDPVNKPSVLSISWGQAEEERVWSEGALDAVNDSFQDAVMMHVTICVASGDDGSDDGIHNGIPDGLAHVDFPASSPLVLAVGGTDLRVVAGRPTERVWKDGNGRRPILPGGTGGSSGGGVSSHFPRPPFQSGLTIASVNPGGIVGRIVPDVAAHAQSDGETTGYFMVLDGAGGPNGGTSASAPLWAALIARINAALGKSVGYLTPLLYQALPGGSTVGSVGCKDVTEGDNISAAIGGYKAGPGYDAVTGWGSPLGRKLLEALRPLV